MSSTFTLRHVAVVLVALGIAPLACTRTPDAVIEAGARNLHCPRSELEVALNRETRSVREYAVACNFTYTLVHCTKSGCRPAPVKPPCVGDTPCFEEDPETLEWRMAEAPRVVPQ
jgi:hypothetical protein